MLLILSHFMALIASVLRTLSVSLTCLLGCDSAVAALHCQEAIVRFSNLVCQVPSAKQANDSSHKRSVLA